MSPHRPASWALDRWATLAALSWLASGALYLTLPPSPDQFQHAYLGWRLIEGDIPYRDFIDQNWPGVMALHALASWIFGVNLWSWRAFDFSLFAVSALFLGDLVRLAAGRDAGRLSLVLCPLIYAGASYWVPGQQDMSAGQFLVGALWFHVRGYITRAWWWQIGTGLFLGAAMLNKPTVGIMGVLLPLHALWLRIPMGTVLAQTATAGAASVATLAAALGAVIALGAPLGDIVDAIYTFNVVAMQVADAKSFAEIGYLVLIVHFRWWPVFVLGSVPAAFWIFRRPNRSIAATTLPVLWATGLLSFFIQWSEHGYHLAPSLLALAGGLAISVVLVATGQVTIGSDAWKRTIAAGFIVIALTGIGVKLASSFYSLPLAFLAGDYGQHLSRFEAGDDLTVADTVAFVRRLDALPPNECVLVVGTASSINYLSMHREPTRFYHFPVLFLARPPLPMAERWVDLWKDDLNAADCRFALVGRYWVHRDNWSQGPSQPAAALRRFLEKYREAGVLGATGGMAIYERR